MNRRTRTLLLGAVPIVAVGAALVTPVGAVPYAAEGPGPLVDVLGDVDGTPIIKVGGTDRVDKPAGEMDMTTVSVAHSLALPTAVGLWLDPEQDLVPIETIFPPGVPQEEVEEQNAVAFTNSESNATVAALRELGLPVETYVAHIVKDGASAGKLEDGDVILAADGKKIDSPAEVVMVVAAHKPGDTVDLRIRRGDKGLDVPVTVGEDPESPGTPHIGVIVGAQPAGGLDITYNVKDIGGPSAGLLLTLGVIDKLSPGDLTGGAHVAGTGTIAPDGTVGPIGGITHKIAAARDGGADFFLVPEDNCAEALTGDPGDMPLIQVGTVDDALKALEDPGAAPRCR